MPRFILLSLLSVFLFYCFSQEHKGHVITEMHNRFSAASARFAQAEQIVQTAGDDETLLTRADNLYREALQEFSTLENGFRQTGNDSLLFMTWLRSGYIHYYFDSLQAAKQNYLSAIALKTKMQQSLPDSILFLPYLYTGAIYYTETQVDSALYYYKKAEELNDRYSKPLGQSQRLYNRLGVMFYENGNYNQARNYFEKAIALHETTAGSSNNLSATYKINIASILIKLEEYEQARQVYEGLLSHTEYRNEIYHNLGIIFQKQNEPQKALTYFKKVNYTDDRKNTDLYYNFALVHADLNNPDSADLWMHRAIAENIRWNGHRKNTIQGLIFKFQGDMAARKKQYRESAGFYQEAIRQFDPGFHETDLNKNPETFLMVTSYINLFNTLTAKADVLKAQYDSEKKPALLENALHTYEAAFKLADHVARTYDSDESRLFLNKIKHFVHNKPIEISLQLFELTQKKDYLHAAYLFDQRNKASILSLNIRENELKNQSGEITSLLTEEAKLKSTITRLSLKAATQTDSTALQALFTRIRDAEIGLGKLREKINADPVWQQKNATEQIPPVSVLQKKLDPYSALLSYHLSEEGLLVLIITANTFEYQRTAVSRSFYTDIELLKTALQNTRGEEKYNGSEAASELYRQLIGPVLPRLQQKKRLIIIPDDELNYLPFEALQDPEKKYLVEKFSIQYQFSTPLVLQSRQQFSSPGTLAFAPFASGGYSDTTDKAVFSALPASGEETSTLNGKVLTDQAATKEQFLQMANHFGIVHLATHASVNNTDPARSFIAFYPGNQDYKLYAREIYDLRLDSTQLIILSACETGTGQLVKGEGLMSLSRAFTYAGCPNIITSLWKAEDRATAFITGRLHTYMEKKMARDEALQAAKIDLLRSNEIDPRYKSPQFWANLIYIGNYEAEQKGKNWWWIAIVIIAGALGYHLLGKRKKNRAA